MTPDELRAELDRARVRPAYLLLGAEPLLRDEALEALRHAVVGGGPLAFNTDRLEGDTVRPGELIDAARTVPVLAPRRLVWLRDSGRGFSRGVLEAIPALVAELATGASTVLVVSIATADRRASWVRAFAEPAAVVTCDPPRGGRALVEFVRREARRQGVRLEPRAAEHLAERVGPQLLALRNELAKAALAVGDGEVVSVSQVCEAVTDVAGEPIWELTDAIGEGRTGDALGVLAKLLSAGAPPTVVLGSLAGHFRRLLRVRAGSRPPGPEFVVRKLEAQSRRYSMARLLAGLRAVQETDEILKGAGPIRPALALERLVLALGS